MEEAKKHRIEELAERVQVAYTLDAKQAHLNELLFELALDTEHIEPVKAALDSYEQKRRNHLAR